MRSQAKVRVPATTANLGPGFDVLGLALALHNEVEIDTGESEADFIEIDGDADADLPHDDTNLVARGAETAFRLAGMRSPPFTLKLTQAIPISRGLGSSAAALVGGALAANALMDGAVDHAEMIFGLLRIEGHAEQLAAATFGGLVAAAPPGDQPLPGRQGKATPTLFTLPVAENLLVALAVPDIQLETKKARRVLPAEVPFSDAVWNIASSTALVAGLADGDGFLVRLGMRDKLHQDVRAQLVPASLDVLAAARDAGAMGAAWSGAGPSMLGICDDQEVASEIAAAMVDAFGAHKIDAEPLVLDIDHLGCVVTELDGEEQDLPVPADRDDTRDEAADGSGRLAASETLEDVDKLGNELGIDIPLDED